MIGVETLIAIAGQLISLVKSRKEHKEDVFATFVEPLFVETEKIISDYLLMYQNVINAIRQGQGNGEAIINAWGGFDDDTKKLMTTIREEEMVINNGSPEDLAFIANATLVELLRYEIYDRRLQKQIQENYTKDRNNLYHARMKVIEMANVYSNSNLSDDIKKFANAIGNIFYLTDSVSDGAYREYRQSARLVSTTVDNYLKNEKIDNPELLKFLERTVKEIRENWEEAIRQYAQLRIKSQQLR